MKTAKIIPNGNSQAIRLPKEFRFNTKEVYIKKEGDKVILSPRPDSWQAYFKQKNTIPDAFMNDVDDVPPEDEEIF